VSRAPSASLRDAFGTLDTRASAALSQALTGRLAPNAVDLGDGGQVEDVDVWWPVMSDVEVGCLLPRRSAF
jgi:hypothetical protein